MKKHILFISFLSIIFSLKLVSQSLELHQDWSISLPIMTSQVAPIILATPDEGCIIAVNFRGDIDLEGNGVNPYFADNQNGLLIKVGANGSIQWSANLNSEQYVNIENLALTSAGDLIVLGSFNGEELFFTEDISITRVRSTIYPKPQIFIAQYNHTGTLQWINTFGNGDGQKPLSLSLDNFDNVYISGSIEKSTKELLVDNDFEIPILEDGGSFIVKYNSEGSFLWGDHRQGEKLILAVDQSNNLIVGTAGFRHKETENGRIIRQWRDLGVTYYSSSGEELWAKLLTTTKGAWFNAIKLLDNGHYWLYTNSDNAWNPTAVYFDGYIPPKDTNGGIIELDSNGQFIRNISLPYRLETLREIKSSYWATGRLPDKLINSFFDHHDVPEKDHYPCLLPIITRINAEGHSEYIRIYSSCWRPHIAVFNSNLFMTGMVDKDSEEFKAAIEVGKTSPKFRLEKNLLISRYTFDEKE